MRILQPISEEEMIAVFLGAELESQRFGAKLQGLLARDGLDFADTDAAYRRRLLDEHRAYEQREGLFGGFPYQVDWFRAALTREEALEIFYIDWSWWLQLSGGTRRPREAARRIRAGELTPLTQGATVAEHEPYLDSPWELIAVTTPAQEKLVLLEGHVRLTSFALFPERVPDELELLLGVSEQMPNWWAF